MLTLLLHARPEPLTIRFNARARHWLPTIRVLLVSPHDAATCLRTLRNHAAATTSPQNPSCPNCNSGFTLVATECASPIYSQADPSFFTLSPSRPREKKSESERHRREDLDSAPLGSGRGVEGHRQLDAELIEATGRVVSDRRHGNLSSVVKDHRGGRTTPWAASSPPPPSVRT